MLNGCPGAMVTGAGRAPTGSSQASNAAPAAADPSSAMGLAEIRSRTGARCAATPASRNRRGAPQSAIMAASCSGVEEGASGAAATPTRNAARKITMYSRQEAAQMAAAPPGVTPSRCSAAAARSTRASSSA